MTQMTDTNDGTAAAQQQTGTGNPGTVDPHLAEWDRNARTQAPVPAELLPVIQFAQGQMVEKVKAEVEKEVETAVNAIAGQEEFKDVPKRVSRGWLEAWAMETPSFKAAYNERKVNPKGWQAALQEAAQGFAEDVKGFASKGGNLRSDVEAAKAAVRGASNTQPPPQKAKSAAELRRMSDREFKQYKAELAARGH
jgi:hypothetical protein